jgi:hypothetical protein
MSINNNSKIYCPTCFLNPKLTLKNLIFNSECLLNHKHQYETLEYFLLDKIKEEDYICLDTNHNNLLDFVKNVIKIFVLNALRIMKNMKMI